MAGLRLTVELGPSPDDLDQVLDVDLDDAAAVIDLTGEPVSYVWDVPGGAQMRLVVQRAATP